MNYFLLPDFSLQIAWLWGFLTDAGYRNHFTRTTRRRFRWQRRRIRRMRKLPDPALIVLPTAAEREKTVHYVKYTLGAL